MKKATVHMTINEIPDLFPFLCMFEIILKVNDHYFYSTNLY